MRPDLHADALWMKEIRADRDVIMWDYRGLNFSPSSLFCPSEVAAPNPTERDAIATAYENEGLDTSINGDAAQNAAFWTEVFESNGYIRCADYFRNELGMDISLYSTESAVRDVVALMEHLGYPAYNVYDGSYGSYVVTELLRFYDENDSEALPPLRAAIIDGVYMPVPIELYEQAYTTARNVLRVFADCEADPVCSEAYPNIRERALSLLKALDEKPLAQDTDEPITAEAIASILELGVRHEGGNPALIPYIPRLVDELERGEVATLQTMIALSTPAAEEAGEAASTEEVDDRFGDVPPAVDGETSAERFMTLLINHLSQLGWKERALLGPSLSDPRVRETFGTAALEQTKVILSVLADSLPGDLLKDVQPVIDAMDENEAQTVVAALYTPEFQRLVNQEITIAREIILCNDRSATVDVEEAFEQYRAYEAPWLIRRETIVPQHIGQCNNLGLVKEPAPMPIPVTSDIRTLVANGTLDHLTPVEWGENVYDNLTNATMITVQNGQHGVLLTTPCGFDTYAAFLANPEQALDLSCVNDLRQEFVLPDDALPGDSTE